MSRNLPIIQSPLPNQHPSIQNLTANRHISPSRANYQSYRQSKIDFIGQSTPKRAPRVSPVSILNLELNEVVSSAKKPVKTEATPKAPLNFWSESRSPKNAKLKFLQMKRNPSRQAGDFSATRTKLNIFQDNSADIKSFIIKRRHPSQLKDNSSDRSVLPRIESSFKKVREQEGSTSRKTTRSIESLRIVKNTSSKDVKVLEQYKIDVQNQIKQLQKTKTIEDTNVNTDLSEPYKLGSTKCVDPSELGSDRFASDKYESHTKLPERPTRQRITITTNQLISDKSLEDIDEKYFLFDDPLEMDYPLEDSEDNLDGFSDDMDTVIMDRGDYMHVREPLQDRLSVEPVESQILQRRYNSNSTSNLLNSPTLSSERGKNSPTTMVDGRNQSLLIKSHVMEPNNHTKMLSVFVKRRLEMLSGEKIDETEDENTTTQMM